MSVLACLTAVWLFIEQIKIGRNEQIMWQRTYIECCAQLGQWKTLEDLGKHVDDFNLLANVYSKSLMWRELKENILPYALVESSYREDMDCLVLQTSIAEIVLSSYLKCCYGSKRCKPLLPNFA